MSPESIIDEVCEYIDRALEEELTDEEKEKILEEVSDFIKLRLKTV